MKQWAVETRETGRGVLCFCGVAIRRLLSAELFVEQAGLYGQGVRNPMDLPTLCHDRWTDLARTLASMPEPLEIFSLIGCRSDAEPDGMTVSVSFLAVGRGQDANAARGQCLRRGHHLWTLLETNLEYTELEPLSEPAEIERAVDLLFQPETVELRRRYEKMRMNVGNAGREPIGFEAAPLDVNADDDGAVHLNQLFPWVPSDDSWRRLVEAVAAEGNRAAFIAHVRGFAAAPEKCIVAAAADLARAENAVALNLGTRGSTVLQLQAEILRRQSLERLAILSGRVLAARVFVSCATPPSPVLLATVESCLDDASAGPSQEGADLLFRGGARLSCSPAGEVSAPLEDPDIDILFGPRESGAFLRTPMPGDADLPGILINRARTALRTGHSGADVLLGNNVHRGQRLPVALDEAIRFRHTYIIGQTGTGKSTLLLHMALEDIRRGRGVAVLDPHGALIEQILLHYPQNRLKDIVIVDATDIERPVGFNPLVIREDDPLQYRLARDLVIDDLYSYLRTAYSDLPEAFGPIFESHFRGMMNLLLGLEPQQAPWVPNLSILRLLYVNKELRQRLTDRVQGKDLMVAEFLREITASGGDHSLANVAQYVTSKFTRFVSDMSLRNITCQNRILDLEDVVNTGKVLLFYLGRGRFGDQAAGLLASQFISHIRRVVMKRGASDSARPFYIYADEFQLFADDRFSELMAEARKFKLSLTLAHQYVKQLPERVIQGILGNVGTTVVFRIGAPDGEFMESIFSPAFRRRDLTSLPNFRAYVRSFGSLGQTPFSLELEPPPGQEDEAFAGSLRDFSRTAYGLDREEIEREIADTYRSFRGDAEPKNGGL